MAMFPCFFILGFQYCNLILSLQFEFLLNLQKLAFFIIIFRHIQVHLNKLECHGKVHLFQ